MLLYSESGAIIQDTNFVGNSFKICLVPYEKFMTNEHSGRTTTNAPPSQFQMVGCSVFSMKITNLSQRGQPEA